MRKIIIDPITRIEGHLKIEALLENNVVKEAKSSGTLYRGFEKILEGRDPRDANRISQRICGVCPASHATASAFSLDNAFGIVEKIPGNGRIIRNLILAANYLHNHILHFYHLVALDYVDVARVKDEEDLPLNSFFSRENYGPLYPRYSGDYRLSKEENKQLLLHYLKALDMRREAQEMLSIFGGKMPHNIAVVPGGATTPLTIDKVSSFRFRLNELKEFVDNVYLPDLLIVGGNYPDYFNRGKGCANLLSFGVFDLEKGKRFYQAGRTSSPLLYEDIDFSKVTEETEHSWYIKEDSPDYSKKGAYSWIKSPRYDEKVYEVGPLARVLVNYASGDSQAKELVDTILKKLKLKKENLFSILGRHLARGMELKLLLPQMEEWLSELKLGEPVCADYSLPEEGRGAGFTEAPRGALGHWLEIKGGKILHYRVISPTTWNASPRDKRGQPGPIEQAIIGLKVKDERNPFEIVRAVRSFDPCLACAVHLITPSHREIGSFRVV